VQTAKV